MRLAASSVLKLCLVVLGSSSPAALGADQCLDSPPSPTAHSLLQVSRDDKTAWGVRFENGDSKESDELRLERESLKIERENRARPAIPSAEFSLCELQGSKVRAMFDKAPLPLSPEAQLFPGSATFKHFSKVPVLLDLGGVNGVRHIPPWDPMIAYTLNRPSDLQEPSKLIIFFHANQENIEMHPDEAPAFLHLAKSLNAWIVRFEYPGYGGPAGTIGETTIASVRWASLAVVNWARQVWGFGERDIVLVGRSIGTGPAAEVVKFYEENPLVNPLGGLILISAYTSAQNIVEDTVQDMFPVLGKVGFSHLVGATLQGFETQSNLKQTSRTPIFLIHGKQDPVISVRHGKAIWDGLRNQSKSSHLAVHLWVSGFQHGETMGADWFKPNRFIFDANLYQWEQLVGQERAKAISEYLANNSPDSVDDLMDVPSVTSADVDKIKAAKPGIVMEDWLRHNSWLREHKLERPLPEWTVRNYLEFDGTALTNLYRPGEE